MDAEVRALIHSVNSLVTVLGRQSGMSAGSSSVITGMVGSKGPVVDAYGIPFEKLDKLRETINKQTDATIDQTKQTKKQTDATVDHIKKLEQFGGVMKSVGDLFALGVKYNITRPYELMGGQAGIVSRGALERERDFGKTITSSIAAVLFAINPLAGAAVAGFGAAGGNQLLGRAFGQRDSLEASGRQSVAQITQAGILPWQEQTMLAFGTGRMGMAARGMGAGDFGSFQRSMAELGIGGPESVPLFGQAVSIGGQRGLSRLDYHAVEMATKAGIYGGPEQVLMGSLLGGRAGMNQGAIEAASRRTGFTMDASGQAAMATRMQTFLAGSASGNRLFEMASRTDMARTGGISAAVGAITGAASGMAGAAEGNEASEMLLFQQFRNANPGASYMDFVEARRNGVNDPRWLKTIRGAANNFAGQGQFGRIMGQALGVASTPMGVAGTAAMMNEAFTGSLGDASNVAGRANLAPGMVATLNQATTTNIAQTAKFQEQYKDMLASTNTELERIAKTSPDWIDMLERTAEVMDKLSVSTLGVKMERGYYNDYTPGG